MNPQARAAADRITAYLDGADQFAAEWADTYHPTDVIRSTNARRPAYPGEENIPSVELRASDLRLVLAALDEHETSPAPAPPEPETCGKRSTWQRWGGILGPCVKPPGHEADEWHFDARGSAWDPAIDATQGAAP